jgi:hypothetical protein
MTCKMPDQLGAKRTMCGVRWAYLASPDSTWLHVVHSGNDELRDTTDR